MRIFKNSTGASAIVVVLFLAAALLVLFSSIGHVLNSLNKATNDLAKYSDNRNVVFDMGQFVLVAYQKAIATGPGLPTCDGTSTPVQISGTFYMCMPLGSFCSQYNETYCLANPYTVSFYEGEKAPDYFVQHKNLSKPPNFALRLILPQTVRAQAPEPWLPDLAGNPSETLTIATPTCAGTTGADIDCIHCGGAAKNAQCVKIKFCTNSTATCVADSFIEPVFAIQTTYGP